MRCKAVLPMQIIIATALQIFAPQHHPCTRAAALAVQMPAHCLQVTAQSTADGLASLLCSLLCYTLTSLLCTSCSLLRSGTLEQPFLLGKLSASGSVIEYHFGITCDAALCLLRPARQQTAHNISGLLLITHNVSHRVWQLPAAPPSGPSSSARLSRAISSTSATSSAACPLSPTTCAPADHLQRQRLAPHYPQRLASCSASAR